MNLDDSGSVGAEIVFLPKNLPQMIGEQEIWRQEPIECDHVTVKHRLPKLFFDFETLRFYGIVHFSNAITSTRCRPVLAELEVSVTRR